MRLVVYDVVGALFAPEDPLPSHHADKLFVRVCAGRGVAVEIELEEGSLITRITVVGSLLLATTGYIADYKGFKESVVEMCANARELAVDVSAPFTTRVGVPKEEIYRFERRLCFNVRLWSFASRRSAESIRDAG